MYGALVEIGRRGGGGRDMLPGANREAVACSLAIGGLDGQAVDEERDLKNCRNLGFMDELPCRNTGEAGELDVAEIVRASGFDGLSDIPAAATASG